MTPHSKIGASSASRWFACPGSVRLSAGLPNYTSEYAAEGIAAHTLAEQCYTSGMQPATFLGKHIHLDRFEIEVTPEMIDAVDIYLDAIKVLRVKGDSAQAEVRFHLKSVHDDLFGTGDFVHFNPKTKVLTVLDLKYGAGVAVEVRDNSQLKYYALGALLELKVGADKVVFGVVQPRCPHPDGPVRTDTIDALDLLEFADALLQAAKATEAPDAPLVTGGHCRWCPAAAICPALRAKANAAAESKFAATPSVPLYDKVMLADALRDLDEIEAYCKSVREFAYAEAERGEAIPGFKLVAKRANRSWIGEQDGAVAKDLRAAFDLTSEQVWKPPVLKSPAQVETVLKAAFKDAKLDKAAAEPKWKTFNAFVKSESSGHVLAPADDPRPEAKPAVAQVFQPQIA